MSSLVIVAIPDENDRVWKISSDKVPHLTLLFLGEIDQVANSNQIVDFVSHAANTTLSRFYMTVDRRGELGDDQADVLFFKKNRYDYKAIRDFRATLLKDNNIRTAYDSAPQFEGPWNPHLTLGYPSAPAKEDEDNFGFYSVDFNKIAVWVDDYDGPEFLLKDYWDEQETLDAVPMDIAMSSLNQVRVDAGMEILEHVGVKGMRWGVRKAKDVRFETSKNSVGTTNALVNGAMKATKEKDLPGINAKYAAKGAKTSTRPHLQSLSRVPVQKAYRNEVREAYRKRLEETANSMTNASGTKRYEISEPLIGTESATRWRVKSRQVQHAVDDDLLMEFEVEPIYDDDGFITDIVVVEDSIAQSVDLGATFILEHYGVKGMKWGVKRDPRTGLTEGETRREGLQRYLDPQGHDLGWDVTKTTLGIVLPVVAPLTWPSSIRMVRGGARGVQKKALDVQEKKFAKNAMSPKNFAAIHNGSLDKVNRGIDTINAKYPEPNKDAGTRKKYDDEVLKTMQDGYRESANSIGNKASTHHLDVEFKNDGLDFVIHAREGAPTSQPKRVKHATEDIVDEEITVEIAGKIKRNATGHIIGLDFDDFEQASLAQSIDVGLAFVLEHFGVKGMRWGHRTSSSVPTSPAPVAPVATSRVPHGKKRKTRIKTEGGENHPAHEDAVKVAESRTKLKKSGTAALSNKELRDVANRLQLEQQVSNLTASRGRRFVRGELNVGGNNQTPGEARAKRAAKLFV